MAATRLFSSAPLSQALQLSEHSLESEALTAHQDPFHTYLFVAIVSGAFLLSLISLVADAIGPRQRQLNDNTQVSSSRGRFCIVFLRACVAAAVVGSMIPGASIAIEYLRAGPLSTLAEAETNTWMYNVMRRSVAAHNEFKQNGSLWERADVGIGDGMLNPTSYGAERLGWSTILLLVFIVSSAGAVIGVFSEYLPVKRGVFVFMIAQGFVWLLGSVAAAYIKPSLLPLDGSPLSAKWMDNAYANNPDALNETRLLSNWVVEATVKTRRGRGTVNRTMPVLKIGGIDFKRSFCGQFNALIPQRANRPSSGRRPTSRPASRIVRVSRAQREFNKFIAQVVRQNRPTTQQQPSGAAAPARATAKPAPPARATYKPPTPGPAAPSKPGPQSTVGPGVIDKPYTKIPAAVLDRSLVSEVFVVYVAGKPIGTGHYRALAYMALGAMVGAPVVIAQLVHSLMLVPFVVLWVFIVFLFILYATPTPLRSITAPAARSEEFMFCGEKYRVLVSDAVTMLIAKLDLVIFALVFATVVVRAYAWLRIGERVEELQKEMEVKPVDYDEVYDRESGALRW